MKRFFNKAIRCLLLADSLVLISMAMLGPIYALFVKKIGGDLLDASYAYGTYAIIAGITTFFSGRYSDKLKENELILVFGYCLMGLGFFGYIFVSSIWMMLVIQVMIGLGEAIYSPAFDALYSKHLKDDEHGKTWGTWEGVKYFTAAIGALTGGLLVTFFGFNFMFFVMGSFCFFSGLYIWLLPRKVL